MDDITDHNAGSSIVSKLRIVRKAQRLEEGHGLRQIGDGQIDKNETIHWGKKDWDREKDRRLELVDHNYDERMRPARTPEDRFFSIFR